jgi:ketosteroid isomerase-like protein
MPSSRPANRSRRQKDSTAAGPLAAIKKLTDAWMRKDRRGMSEHLTDDITELGPTFATPLKGKPDFFQKYQAYFSEPLQVQSYRMLRPRLVHLTPWLVLVHFRYRMTTENHGHVEKVAGQESLLVELRRGRWRVKFIHWHRR